MPILPLNHPDPFAATLGVMLYPEMDEAGQRKARSFTTNFLAVPVRRYYEAGYTLREDELRRIVCDGGARLGNVEKRLLDGLAVGQTIEVLMTLADTRPQQASVENALRVVAANARKHGVLVSRSSLLSAYRRYRPVAHLWAAWCFREGRFVQMPEVGYQGTHDHDFFLLEAEGILHWGRTWRHERTKATPPLKGPAWRVPQDWRPPIRQRGWPEAAGKVPRMTLSEEALGVLRSPGRPKGVRRGA